MDGFELGLVVVPKLILRDVIDDKWMQGQAMATTSAQNQGGQNRDGNDERKRKEADKAYRRFQIRKAEKVIAELLHNLTKDDHIFPRSPSQKEWLNVTRKV
ncbi:hypothetical protein NC651_009877 [Populus alba x Populus x berolinensis]|nr:hypothetical protein NC651_009877 [Populus alba x Populus x berolinensis]